MQVAYCSETKLEVMTASFGCAGQGDTTWTQTSSAILSPAPGLQSNFGQPRLCTHLLAPTKPKHLTYLIPAGSGYQLNCIASSIDVFSFSTRQSTMQPALDPVSVYQESAQHTHIPTHIWCQLLCHSDVLLLHCICCSGLAKAACS